MNICFLVPSAEHALQAGVRIRYRGIEQALADQGHELHITPIQALLDQMAFGHDVYVISKCYDARALLVAELLRESKRLVGVDLFDDYFSQRADSRFTGLRYWLRNLARMSDFFLCSTHAMADVARAYDADMPLHVMNDTAGRPEPADLYRRLRRKLESLRCTGVLNVAWFGIGDNPHFPVGLRDLVAYGHELARLRERGYAVNLGILTNPRALNAEGVAMLRRLAVPYTVEEWSEEREARLLAASLIAFLPVNAQNFSAAKSLNRALSALCSGTQVLSSGFPLYEALASLVYRDPERLLDDLKRERLALRDDTVPQLMELVGRWADAGAQTSLFVRFLERQLERKAAVPQALAEQPLIAVLHGRKTTADVHESAQRIGALSICTPFCTAELDFDVRLSFGAQGDQLDILVAERCYPLVARHVQPLLARHGNILKTSYRRLDASALGGGECFAGAALGRMGTAMSVAGSYPHVMAGAEKLLRVLFPGVRCHYSEQAGLPWHLAPS